MYEKTYIAIAASGTVSAELAIMHIPAIIVYKMNPLTMMLGRLLVKVKWVSLVNILLKKSVYPELLGNNANTDNILKWVSKLSNPSARDKIILELAKADKMWRRGAQSAAHLIAKDIVNSIT